MTFVISKINDEAKFPLIEDIAMQTSDKFSVATPADWYPGDDVIISPVGSCGVAEQRMTSTDELDCKDWFFCAKNLDKNGALNTLLKN